MNAPLPALFKQGIKQQNRYNKWKYGYNKEYDLVIISKTGKIGEIYEIQNLRIALPLIEDSFKRTSKKEEQHWEQLKIPKELEKIKSVFRNLKKAKEFMDKLSKTKDVRQDSVMQKIQQQLTITPCLTSIPSSSLTQIL